MMGCDAHVLYFGLLVGATLGGNLTPIGASANIAAIGILQKEGYEVKATDRSPPGSVREYQDRLARECG